MVDNIIVISDTHFGCQYGLFSPNLKVKLDSGGSYVPSPGQKKVWNCWEWFWKEWIPDNLYGKKYIVVFNGDCIDGVHHKNTTHITASIKDQLNIAYEVLAPIRENAENWFHIRGTSVHVGQEAEFEEQLAQRLGSEKDSNGNSSRWTLWLNFHDTLIHFCHTIGGTGVTSYESTAVIRELVEAFNDSGRWQNKPPQIVVRSHRHKAHEIKIPAYKGKAISLVTSAWQLKTGYVFNIPSARVGTPTVGGHLIYYDGKKVDTDFNCWAVTKREVINV